VACGPEQARGGASLHFRWRRKRQALPCKTKWRQWFGNHHKSDTSREIVLGQEKVPRSTELVSHTLGDPTGPNSEHGLGICGFAAARTNHAESMPFPPLHSYAACWRRSRFVLESAPSRSGGKGAMASWADKTGTPWNDRGCSSCIPGRAITCDWPLGSALVWTC
jgi:hypothetical protein